MLVFKIQIKNEKSNFYISSLFIKCILCIESLYRKKDHGIYAKFPVTTNGFCTVRSVLDMKYKVIKGTADAKMITRVGQRISVAAERWLDANNHQGYLKDYKWEYNLVEDEMVNAWCMPGGKIVFYTGFLPIAENEAGVAAIMGHEVAHALANHGQQRMSAGMLQQAAAVGVAVAHQ